MAASSSTLAWEIPWTEETVRLQSMESPAAAPPPPPPEKELGLFLAVLGLCYVRLLIVLASLVEHTLGLRLRSWLHGLSCPVTCGIFLERGSNLWPPTLTGGLSTTGPPGKS